jgi:hypothetical protein
VAGRRLTSAAGLALWRCLRPGADDV